jgi:2-polyprenyl-3-methyl-5-hydroxy-6-metoxy-1,4-benzoquinol methylase
MQITRAPRRHLSEAELLDCTRACPICLSAAPRHARVRVQRHPDVVMLECPACRGCSASHMPRPEVLRELYARYYDGFGRETTFANAARFARHLVRLLPRDAPPRSLRILDYGGGDGSLSLAVAERLIAFGRASEAAIDVVDFVQREERRTANVTVRFRTPAEPPSEPYDLVLASAILEHVPELHALLRALVAAIAPHGLFYARTPYAIPLTRLLPRLDLTYPAHVHDLGSPFWNRVAETFGWPVRVVASRPSLVAGTLTGDPLRAVAALALKWPAHVESFFSPRARMGRLWHLAGGWEVVLRRK